MYYKENLPSEEKGGGDQKIAKILRMSFMEDPLQ